MSCNATRKQVRPCGLSRPRTRPRRGSIASPGALSACAGERRNTAPDLPWQAEVGYEAAPRNSEAPTEPPGRPMDSGGSVENIGRASSRTVARVVREGQVLMRQGDPHDREHLIDFLGEAVQAILPSLAHGDQILVVVGPDRLQHDGELKRSRLTGFGDGGQSRSMRSRNLARGFSMLSLRKSSTGRDQASAPL